MTNSSWRITTYEDRSPAATADGVDYGQAVAAIREAMYGADPLTELRYVSDVDAASRRFGRTRRIAPRRSKIAA